MLSQRRLRTNLGVLKHVVETTIDPRPKVVEIECQVIVTMTREQFATIRSKVDLEIALEQCIEVLTSGGEHPIAVNVWVQDWDQLA